MSSTTKNLAFWAGLVGVGLLLWALLDAVVPTPQGHVHRDGRSHRWPMTTPRHPGRLP